MIGALAVLLWAIAVVRLAGVRTHRPSPGAATLTVTFLLLAVATTLRWASGPPPAPGVAPNLPGIVPYVLMLAAAAAIVMAGVVVLGPGVAIDDPSVVISR